MRINEIREQRAAKVAELRTLLDTAEREGRSLTADEAATFDATKATIAGLEAAEQRQQFMDEAERRSTGTPVHGDTGSLELRETERGLEYRLNLPDTTTGRDLRELAQRGDLGGVSFGFRVVRDSWQDELRTLQEVELHEVSIVQAWPAYPTTTVSLRSRLPGDRDRLGTLRLWLETCR